MVKRVSPQGCVPAGQRLVPPCTAAHSRGEGAGQAAGAVGITDSHSTLPQPARPLCPPRARAVAQRRTPLPPAGPREHGRRNTRERSQERLMQHRRFLLRHRAGSTVGAAPGSVPAAGPTPGRARPVPSRQPGPLAAAPRPPPAPRPYQRGRGTAGDTGAARCRAPSW